jgi:replicative DNA helicase
MKNELEKRIVANILHLNTREEQIDAMVSIKIGDFQNPVYRMFLVTINSIIIKNERTADSIGLFENHKEYKNEIADLSNAEISKIKLFEDIREIKANAFRQKLIDVVETGHRELNQAQYLSEFKDAKNRLLANISGIDFEHDSKFLEYTALDHQLMQNLNKENSTLIDGYSWGLKTMDIYTNGIEPGRFYVIGALKKAGKTRFVVHTIRELIHQDVRTCFLSLEVPPYPLYRMLKASMAGMEDTALRSGEFKNLTPDQQTKLKEIVLDQNQLLIECNTGLGLSELLGRVKRYAHLGAKVIVIDFLQRIVFDIKNPVQELTEISNRLADASRQLNVAIILLCQLSNVAEKETPSISHLKGTGGIAEAADTIMIFDNMYRRLKKEEHRNKVRIELTQRYGESAVFYIGSDLGLCRFYDIAKHPDVKQVKVYSAPNLQIKNQPVQQVLEFEQTSEFDI